VTCQLYTCAVAQELLGSQLSLAARRRVHLLCQCLKQLHQSCMPGELSYLLGLLGLCVAQAAARRWYADFVHPTW
jgi:hypothetical protein